MSYNVHPENATVQKSSSSAPFFSKFTLFLSDFRMISKSLVSNTVVKPKDTLPGKVQNSIKRKELSDKSFCP